MWLRRPSIADAVLAALCGIAVAAFMLPTTLWGLPAALAVAALVVVAPQRPLTAGALLAALYLALWSAGVTKENSAPLVPFFVGVYILGRYAPLWRGALLALVFVIVTALDAFQPGPLAFSLVLNACIFGYGRVVQLRAQRARSARTSAAELQATDAASLAARIVADERARLGGQSLGLLRTAVEGMRADAAAARSGLEPGLIDSVCRRGRLAVTELRWLLGILRSEPDLNNVTPVKRPDRLGSVVNIVLAACLLVVGVLEVWLEDFQPSSPLAWILAFLLPACALAGRRFTLLACSVAAAGIGAALLAGVLPTAANLLCIVLLAWSAGTAGRLAVWLVFGALAAGMALWGAQHYSANWPFTLALLAVPAFAGFEWSAQDRAARDASARAEKLRLQLDARIDSARRDERLRIARELHDVTSHAVGVMVLQASAASALRERDPAAARDALKTVDETAAQALRELDMMFQLLDSGAIGAPGLAGGGTLEPLESLVDRMRKSGLDISLEQDSIPANLGDVVYRVVQESLTNVVSHSNARHVRITVDREQSSLHVCVVDDGTRPADRPTSDADAPGFGLTGLGERVEGAGGEFRAGWVDDGFAVDAVLSIEPVASL